MPDIQITPAMLRRAAAVAEVYPKDCGGRWYSGRIDRLICELTRSFLLAYG